MYKKLFSYFVFVATILTLAQFAAADYTLANGTTETVWVAYSRWLPANANWPEGWRTEGWYKIEPDQTRSLRVPQRSSWVYIRVENADGGVKPRDHATRESFQFQIHPSKAFTVVETDEGDFLKSNRVQRSLEFADLYEYLNGGSHTITNVLPEASLASRVFDKHSTTLQRESIRSVLPAVLESLKDPNTQPLLNPATINLVVSNPNLLRQFAPDIDPKFVTLLKKDAALRAVLRDPLVQELLQQPTAIDELAGLLHIGEPVLEVTPESDLPAQQNFPDLPAQQIHDEAMPSVVWIENFDDESFGSGTLVDQERKLVVTNQHVTEGAEFVFVSFPVPDRNGTLIDDRDYYRENYLWLALNGYGAWGRVIAEDRERDVAVLQLDFLYEDSREINHGDFVTDFSRNMKKNEIVHLMGNPGATNLWDWRIGSFQSDDGRMINIDTQAYDGRGSSGGPVLNTQGMLIGIIQSGTGQGWIGAVPARYIKDLLDTVSSKHTFRIKNDAPFTIRYEIKWANNGNWKQYSLNASRELYHWLSSGDVSQSFPKIRFDAVVNDGQFTPAVYPLVTFLRYFGSNYRDHVSFIDAYGYIFYYNRSTREIDIFRSQNEGCVPMDVNGDGQTNLRDLDFIAERIGTLWPGEADVDQDGDVDVSDIVFAAGLLCGETAAPSVNQDLAPTLTTENLRMWINQAKQFDVSDPIFQRGIAVLEQLLAKLTPAEVIPTETLLLTNYPNPFNPETWLPYQLSKPAEVTVIIHAADGRLIRTLALGHQPAGVYQSKTRAAYWDGRNELGESVASGVYFYTLKAGDFTATRKMLIRK